MTLRYKGPVSKAKYKEAVHEVMQAFGINAADAHWLLFCALWKALK